MAVKNWLVKKCTLTKMKFYTRARENYLSEMFNSVINKYAQNGSITARVTLLEWLVPVWIGMRAERGRFWQEKNEKQQVLL
jgi:hypothetical protein